MNCLVSQIFFHLLFFYEGKKKVHMIPLLVSRVKYKCYLTYPVYPPVNGTGPF